MDYNRVVNIEETGCLSNLLEGGLSECLLNDDVKQLVHDGLAVQHLVRVRHAYSHHRFIVHVNFLLFSFKNGFEFAGVLEGRQSVDALS